MYIVLNREMEKDEILYVEGVLEKIKLPAIQLLVLDTNILFPTIFPPKERNVDKLTYYSEHVTPGYRTSNKVRSRNIAKVWNKRRIKVVNSIEDKELQRKGFHPAMTNIVYGELKNLERICGVNNLNEWKGKLKNDILDVMVDVKFFRKAYPILSEKFDENADFSLAIASYELGSYYASDDYKSFDRSTMKILEGMYFDRWHPQRLKTYDSESVCMILRP